MTLYVYADTSALAKRFWREPDTDLILSALADAKAVASASLGYVELVSATCRAARRVDVAQKDVPRVLAAIEEDWNDVVRIPVDEGVINTAAALVQEHPLRAYDAVHLAAALRWQSLVGERVMFLAFDKELLKAASAEGLMVQAVTPGK